MPRLIDADKIKLPQGFFEKVDNVPKFYEWLDEQPTVDAVPVVRCKDCKWYEVEQLKRDGTDDKRYKPSVCVIGIYAEQRKADWYCADGERKEDGRGEG